MTFYIIKPLRLNWLHYLNSVLFVNWNKHSSVTYKTKIFVQKSFLRSIKFHCFTLCQLAHINILIADCGFLFVSPETWTFSLCITQLCSPMKLPRIRIVCTLHIMKDQKPTSFRFYSSSFLLLVCWEMERWLLYF